MSNSQEVLLGVLTIKASLTAEVSPGQLPASPKLQEKSVTPTNQVQVVTPDAGYLLSKVTVGASAGGDNTIVINGMVEEIPYRFFQDCTNLTGFEHSFINGATALTINADAFKNCTGLKTVKVPHCATIKSGAFSGCTGIEDYWFGYKNTGTPSQPPDLLGYLAGKEGFKIHIPAGATEIFKTNAFWDYYSDHFVEDYVL